MATKLANHIGQKLQMARSRKDLTQAEVARRAGTNTNYYAKLERGEAVPSLAMLEKIVKALRTDSSDVLPF
jgi:transcriptional regulator with XRE-family HTH domain